MFGRAKPILQNIFKENFHSLNSRVLVFFEDGRIGMQHIFSELYFHGKYLRSTRTDGKLITGKNAKYEEKSDTSF